MSSMKLSLVLGSITVIIVVLAIINYFPKQQNIEPHAPVKLTLEFSSKPLLNKEANLIFTIKSYGHFPNATLQIKLPEGFQLVSGTPKVLRYMKENDTERVELVVRAVKTGDWEIIAQAISVRPSVTSGETEYLYATITETDATVLTRQERNKTLINPENPLEAARTD